MNKLSRIVLCAAFCTTASLALASTNSLKKIDSALVRLFIFSKDQFLGSGTGFAVGKDGLVATNYHVIEDAYEIVAARKAADGKIEKYPVSVIARNPALDVALIRVEGLNVEPLEVATKPPSKGDKVYALGFPGIADLRVAKEKLLEGKLESTVTEGVVGRVFQGTWAKGGPELTIIQHSAAINGGNSGGPLVDRCGAIVGINTAGLRAVGKLVAPNVVVADQNQGIFYASSITEIISELKSKHVPIEDPNNSATCIAFGGSDQIDSQGSNNRAFNYLIVGIAITSIILIGFAIYFLTRKPLVVSESYTHYVKRTGNDPAKPIKTNNDKHSLKLCLSSPSGNKKWFPLVNDKTYTIGRDSQLCQIAIDDPSVSRKHALIKAVRGGVEIRDLDSTNGTFVGDERVAGNFKFMKTEDSARIGKVKIRIEKI